MDHRSQIELLHSKASEGNFFSRFNYEQLAFVDYLNNNPFLESENEAESIKKLKNDKIIRAEYLSQITYHRLLKKVWNSMVEKSQLKLIDQQDIIQNL